MQRMYDNLALALAIVASLGCVSACFYMVYHSAMIAVCYCRDTPPDQRAHTRPTYRLLMGLLAFLGFFLLLLLLDSRN
jgi:hypothetical protein